MAIRYQMFTALALVPLLVSACGTEISPIGYMAGKGDGEAVPGRWIIPPEVLARGDAQHVEYTGASSCVGGPTVGARRLKAHLQQQFPRISTIHDYDCRNIVGGSSLSVHAAGRALDLMIPLVRGDANNAAGDLIGNWLIENAESIGIQYIIWDGYSWNGSRAPGAKARSYGGADAHIDHLHVELSVAGGNASTTFFSGGATTPVAPPPTPDTNPNPNPNPNPDPTPTPTPTPAPAPADTTPPTVRIVSPTSGARFDPGNITLTVDANDNVGVDRVELVRDGRLIDVRRAAPYTFALDLDQGSHTLTAVAYDAAGLSAQASVSITVGPINPVDAHSPVVSIVSPSNGAVVPAGPVTVTTTATDDYGVSRLELLVDGALVQTRSSLPFNFEANLTAGQRELTVVAYDAAGNSGRASVVVTVSDGDAVANPGPDVHVPRVTIISPAAGSVVPAATVVQAMVLDDSRLNQVVLKVNGTVAVTLQPAPSYRFYVSLPTGPVTLLVEATDLAGNTGTATVEVIVSDTPDPTIPAWNTDDGWTPTPAARSGSTIGGCAMAGSSGAPSLLLPLLLCALVLLRCRRA